MAHHGGKYKFEMHPDRQNNGLKERNKTDPSLVATDING
jgi:hypothetical protein